jgi:hypothetical protein
VSAVHWDSFSLTITDLYANFSSYSDPVKLLDVCSHDPRLEKTSSQVWEQL